MRKKISIKIEQDRLCPPPAPAAGGRRWRMRRLLLPWLLCALLPLSLGAQNLNVSGTVLDGNSEPVAGASVVVKGSTVGAITDANGGYSISVPSDATLVFSFLGLATKEEPVNGRGRVDVTLNESDKALDEVVVVGYGVQKKASLTSAISQISGDDAFKDRGINNASVALQGEVPGLIVTRTSTRPGSENVAMQIRGDISVNGNSSPLVLIDGISGSLDELNQMNPSDIESVSVLKDASAAIYGARSASGVLLVTTKRGRQGKASITYSSSISTTIDGIQPPITSNSEWLDMFYDAQYRDAMANNPDLTSEQDIKKQINWWIFATGSVLPGVDANGQSYDREDLWRALRDGETLVLTNSGKTYRYEPGHSLMDELYGQSFSHKHSVGISGADDKFGYRASLGYANNQSQLKVAEDGEKKYSARLNMDYQATKILKFETGMSYEIRNITMPSTNVGDGYYDPWIWPVYNENGHFYDTFGNRNPVGGLVDGGHIKTDFQTLRANIKATLDLSLLTQGLSVAATGAYKRVGKDIQTLKNKIQYYDWVDVPTTNRQGPGSLSEDLLKWENRTFGGFVNYERQFNQVHNVSAMLGMTAEEENYKRILASRSNGPLYEGAGLVDLETMVSGTNNGANGGQNSWGFVSYITRLNYSYNDRYLVEFLGRRDGSSKLSASQQWKNFYSVSGGWVISNESFMENLRWLDNLKARYSYGKTGSVEGVEDYERYATISTGSAYFGTALAAQSSMWLGGMTSESRTWETIISHDVGVDFAFLKSRLSGSFDYFSKTNDGMFIPVTYPSVLGATAPKTNNGKFEAKGWEFSLSWRDKIGALTYNVGGFVADASAKVIELENNENVPQAGYNRNRLIGMPRNAIYVYKTDGIFQTQAEADAYYDQYYWNADRSGPKSGNIIPAPQEKGTNRLRPGARKLADTNGDGAITTDDLSYAGDAAPHYTFGFKVGLEWKGIDFQAFFQGVGQQVVLRTGNIYAPWVTNYTLQNTTFMGKMWTEENPNAEYTVASRDQNFNKWNYENKDVSVQNSTYLRMKSLIVGYTLPKHLTSKVSLEKVRVYFSGDDLWEWTKIKDGYDPEHGEASNNTFPFSRLLSFGLDITF
ncbi:MAG: TonB-dependent receptor [Prevotellaceae bacterium]|nr:TonB-dependent receptor [Prevotellaceae bacterium]